MKLKITLQLDTNEDAAFLKAIGLSFSPDSETLTGKAPGKAKTAPPAPANAPAASPPPATASEPPAAAAAPAVDETLLPEIRKAMSSFGGLTEPKTAVAYMRELGYQSAAAIPPQDRPSVLAKIQEKIDKIVEG